MQILILFRTSLTDKIIWRISLWETIIKNYACRKVFRNNRWEIVWCCHAYGLNNKISSLTKEGAEIEEIFNQICLFKCACRFYYAIQSMCVSFYGTLTKRKWKGSSLRKNALPDTLHLHKKYFNVVWIFNFCIKSNVLHFQRVNSSKKS